MSVIPLVEVEGLWRTGKDMWAVSLLLASASRLRSRREMVNLAGCWSRNWVREFLLYFTYSISPNLYDKPMSLLQSPLFYRYSIWNPERLDISPKSHSWWAEHSEFQSPFLFAYLGSHWRFAFFMNWFFYPFYWAQLHTRKKNFFLLSLIKFGFQHPPLRVARNSVLILFWTPQPGLLLLFCNNLRVNVFTQKFEQGAGLPIMETVSSKSVALSVWSQTSSISNNLGTCKKCKFSGSIPSLLNRELWAPQPVFWQALQGFWYMQMHSDIRHYYIVCEWFHNWLIDSFIPQIPIECPFCVRS